MENIKLKTGQVIKLEITPQTVLDIKNSLNYIIIDVGKNSDIEKLLDDTLNLVNVLYLCCKEDCDEKKISDVQFGRGLNGKLLQEATEKFLVELKNFLPQSKRMILEHSLQMQAEIMEEVTKTSIAKMVEMKPQIVGMIQKELTERLDLNSLEKSFSSQK